ncbi:UCH-domain-containing protein [Xylariaceae sp. FL1651]|nr:UCH-domain-containing protein [Xylariaceae sp. FL1651]
MESRYPSVRPIYLLKNVLSSHSLVTKPQHWAGEGREQLAVKTSSLKKRKITTRRSAARNEELEPTDLPDIPLQSCEQDLDPSFSFTSSTIDVPASPAYLRADSLPPASSLPPRLQTNHSGSHTLAEDGSSVASSPSGAYADLTISSDRGADTPAPEFANCPRGTSPFTKTTHHRAIMGGAAEFPERASSPLKRRASSMEPDSAAQNGNQDVDMITAPPSDAMDRNTSIPEHQSSQINDFSEPIVSSQEHTQTAGSAENMATTIDTTPGTFADYFPPASIEAHINAIRAHIDEFERNPLEDGQECYIVSKQWLANVPDGSPKKQATIDLSTIPPVDNSDIILEVIDDPCKKFVRLKIGYTTDHFVAFPPAAWELLMQWPGLKEGQFPIRHGSNIQFEFHPLVLSIHRLWSANSRVPVEASLKAHNPPAPRLARSSNMKFQAFLKQAKAMAQIDLMQRVRGWQILNASASSLTETPATVPTPPASPMHIKDATNSSTMWNHLLKGAERDVIGFGDLTNGLNSSKKSDSGQTLRTLGIAKDQPIVLDPHEEGTEWTSTYTPTGTTTLPTRSSSTNLTVQTNAHRDGRTSPISIGPTTRGRSTKSGRNTCYMNAALQCVRTGEWEKELNKANVLAHNGEVAATYAQLLKDIYKDSAPSAVTPRQFKNTIGRHAPQFSGYGQQDSQEFLGFLLDGLQEDLSRVKKKPYIEKPDSTDEMIGDPDAIRKMANEVWDITRKRDDSVIADLFTGLYNITFDPFNNLTLQLPIANKWNHTVKFFPLNDRPVEIRVELNKHDSIGALKQFVSARTGVPTERLHGCEEWSKKFYKHYLDSMSASEEISGQDHAWIFELEAKPTNYPGKAPKQQKYRSTIDDEPSMLWDDEQAESLLVPVMHRKPGTKRFQNHHRWVAACIPHFIVVTPQEARSEDIIRRKILEKLATFTKHPSFARSDESDGSESTEPEMIGPNGSDTASSIGGKVVTQSVKGEDDIVDVQMKDVSDARNTVKSHLQQHQFNRRKPAWVDARTFLPPHLQNLFEIGICAETSSPIPTGNHSVTEDKDYPKLSSRIPVESPSSEDLLDNATNGTASNDESSSDEASRHSTEMPPTRMNEESDNEDNSLVVKSFTHRPKQGRPTKGNTKPLNGRKKIKGRHQHGNKGANKKRQRQQRQLQEKQNAISLEDPADLSDPVPDGGPLIRLKEGLVVDWAEGAYEEVFGADGSFETWETCEIMPDPDLEKTQAARAKRRKHGLTLDECLDEFERDEVLSEQDMWYCPRCKEHRRASKKLDLWKTPDILIIHLKRFSSSGYRRDKLETLVDFPTDNLDITSRVLQREEGKQEIYDLIGVDCHFGGLGGGHYTAYAKNFVDGQWYSYNDSSVSKISTERIVDSSAYMLFYRRRSNVPLGGPNFHRILERFVEPNGSDDEMSVPGEGRRLGEGFSQNGSSSALQGAGATHLPVNRGGNSTTALTLHRSNMGPFETDDKGDDDIPLLASTRFQPVQSIEEDEGIELADNTGLSGIQQPFTGINTWSFENISTTVEDSPFGSGAASDEAQHDSSGDERALSPQEDLDPSYPGMSEYKLPPQTEVDAPSYMELPVPGSLERPMAGDMNRIWDVKHEVHEVLPNGEQEPQSDDAAEIHLDDDDKIKVQ